MYLNLLKMQPKLRRLPQNYLCVLYLASEVHTSICVIKSVEVN